MVLSRTDLTVNLLSEGEQWFDLLKASIRQWQKAPWEHERARAGYALELYRRSLELYRNYLDELRGRTEGGYFTDQDRRLLQDMETMVAHWEKKLDEVQQLTVNG